ncbi:hippurate hydrolase [Edaphobacter aggregans]|uniref:Hippurate hydrolase n=1 Tax=Edaphobacter aggregans TaxID=570835 RepID=A0A428MH18_9BACT|nr:amidohydrolase [Edaphobacter aggregans]RSL15973.1 hippurate hydrolase [Edaphobacter aggregans]
MRGCVWAAVVGMSLGAGAVALAQDVTGIVGGEVPGLMATYKGLHGAPELSHHEEKTSALLAEELRKAGFTVTERVGKYPDGTQGFGVVGILKNGAGPTLLIRADMDALPVTEATGLPYASTVRAKNPAGQDVGVMHACGHDIHVTTMIGVARAMAAMKDKWRGTLMLIGQPSEETIDGAKAMMADHLYERFGKPDMAIALHDANFAAGKVSVVPGPALASSTSIDVVMRGVGSHGSAPEAGKDPIVMAAAFITQVQTVVSRSVSPQQPAVVTVGDIHGGTKRNIIPDEVKMELTTRSYSEEVRQTIIDGVKRTARGVAIAAGVPEDRMPVVTVLEDESTPAMINDVALSARLQKIFVAKLGAENVVEKKPIMGSEDFGIFSMGEKIPAVIFWLGAYDPAKVAESEKTGKSLPSPHSPLFAPLPEPALRTGITAMTDAALELLQ